MSKRLSLLIDPFWKNSKQLREKLKENVKEAEFLIKHVFSDSLYMIPQLKDEQTNYKDLNLSLDKAIWHCERCKYILKLLEEVRNGQE